MSPSTALKQLATSINDPAAAAMSPKVGSVPSSDLGQLFHAGQMAGPDPQTIDNARMRYNAILGGNVEIADTGDGVSRGPDSFDALGITEPREQDELATLEAMVGKAMPGFDLRSDYKADPEFYKELFAAIREGIPDPKTGKKRKLTTAEIIDYIGGGQAK